MPAKKVVFDNQNSLNQGCFACLLQASATPPESVPDYDDWFG